MKGATDSQDSDLGLSLREEIEEAKRDWHCCRLDSMRSRLWEGHVWGAEGRRECSLETVKEATLSRGRSRTATQLVLWGLRWPFRVGSNYSKEARALHSHIDQSLDIGCLQKRGIILGQVSFFHQVQLPKSDWAEPSATNNPTAGEECWIWVRKEQPSIHDIQVSCPSAQLWGQECLQLKWGREEELMHLGEGGGSFELV